MSKRVFKRSLYDIVSVWNQILAIIAIINIVMLIANLFLENIFILVIAYVINVFLVMFIITEVIIVKHNDKILKQFYLSESEIAIFSKSK